jgi:hypothetical protein
LQNFNVVILQHSRFCNLPIDPELGQESPSSAQSAACNFIKLTEEERFSAKRMRL